MPEGHGYPLVVIILFHFVLWIYTILYICNAVNQKNITSNTFSKKKEKAMLLMCLFMPMLISKFFKIKIDINNDLSVGKQIGNI